MSNTQKQNHTVHNNSFGDFQISSDITPDIGTFQSHSEFADMRLVLNNANQLDVEEIVAKLGANAIGKLSPDKAVSKEGFEVLISDDYNQMKSALADKIKMLSDLLRTMSVAEFLDRKEEIKHSLVDSIRVASSLSGYLSVIQEHIPSQPDELAAADSGKKITQNERHHIHKLAKRALFQLKDEFENRAEAYRQIADSYSAGLLQESTSRKIDVGSGFLISPDSPAAGITSEAFGQYLWPEIDIAVFPQSSTAVLTEHQPASSQSSENIPAGPKIRPPAKKQTDEHQRRNVSDSVSAEPAGSADRVTESADPKAAQHPQSSDIAPESGNKEEKSTSQHGSIADELDDSGIQPLAADEIASLEQDVTQTLAKSDSDPLMEPTDLERPQEQPRTPAENEKLEGLDDIKISPLDLEDEEFLLGMDRDISENAANDTDPLLSGGTEYDQSLDELAEIYDADSSGQTAHDINAPARPDTPEQNDAKEVDANAPDAKTKAASTKEADEIIANLEAKETANRLSGRAPKDNLIKDRELDLAAAEKKFKEKGTDKATEKQTKENKDNKNKSEHEPTKVLSLSELLVELKGNAELIFELHNRQAKAEAELEAAKDRLARHKQRGFFGKMLYGAFGRSEKNYKTKVDGKIQELRELKNELSEFQNGIRVAFQGVRFSVREDTPGVIKALGVPVQKLEKRKLRSYDQIIRALKLDPEDHAEEIHLTRSCQTPQSGGLNLSESFTLRPSGYGKYYLFINSEPKGEIWADVALKEALRFQHNKKLKYEHEAKQVFTEFQIMPPDFYSYGLNDSKEADLSSPIQPPERKADTQADQNTDK